MDQQRSVMSPEKRLFTAHIMQSATVSNTISSTTRSSNGTDMTDNMALNDGSDGLYRTTKYLTKSEMTTTTNGKVTTITSEVSNTTNGASPCKSFIEQRVERLYGPGALAQGFHANRRSMEKTVLGERNIYSNGTSKFASPLANKSAPIKAVNGNGMYTPKRAVEDPSNGSENVDRELLEDTIPVLRHLRPEFRAQLPISSPKRSPPPKTNGSSAVNDNEVLVNHPLTLQFQTVSISKLQHTTTTPARQTNGTAAKTAVPVAIEPPPNHDEIAAVVPLPPLTPKNAETIRKTADPSVGEEIHNHNPNSTGRIQTTSIERQSNSGDSVVGREAEEQKSVEVEAQKEETTVTTMPTKQDIVVSVEDKENALVKGACAGVLLAGKKGIVEKDGHHFLDVMNGERNRILALADHCDTYLDQVAGHDDEEELVGVIRAASGKARLLSAQKMNQFQGLCHNQLNQSPDEKFPTTSEDLQGFWDMLMLQVNHVDKLFAEIEDLKKNNWKKCADSTDSLPPPQGAKLVKRPGTKATTARSTTGAASAAATAAAQKREAARKQLMELKRKNKLAMTGAGGESPVVE